MKRWLAEGEWRAAQPAADGQCHLVDQRRDPRQAEECASAHQGHYRVVVGRLRRQRYADARNQAGKELVPQGDGQCLRVFEVRLTVVVGGHPFGEDIGEVEQDPAVAGAPSDDLELGDTETQTALLLLLVDGEPDLLWTGQMPLPR